jgi:hypothetical protein
VWIQNFVPGEQGGRWRTEEDGLPLRCSSSLPPYEDDAHYARTYTTSWVGYKVHLSETCDDDAPHLITNVVTTPAPVAEGDATPLVHEALRGKGLLPGIHRVDTGYLDAELLVASQLDYGWSYWARRARMSSGKRAQGKASTLSASRSTGSSSGRSASKGIPVSAGPRRSTTATPP